MDYSDQDLVDAFNAADKAGNADDAAAFSAEIQRRQGLASQPAQTTQPAQPTFPRGGAVGNVNPPAVDRDPAHTAAVHAAFEAQPWWQKLATIGGDDARLAASNFTGGLNKVAAAGLNKALGGDYGQSLDTLNQGDADAAIRQGWGGTLAGAAGSILGPGKIMRGEQLAVEGANRLSNFVSPYVTRFIGRGVAGAGENEILNATNNISQGKNPQEGALPALAAGAGFGVGVPLATRAVGTAIGGLPGMTLNATVPNTAEMMARKEAAYAPLNASNEPYSARDWNSSVADLRQNLNAAGPFGPLVTPKMYAHLEFMAGRGAMPGAPNAAPMRGGQTWSQVDNIRSKISKALATTNDADEIAAGTAMRDHLNNFIQNTDTIHGTNLGAQDIAAREANRKLGNSQLIDSVERGQTLRPSQQNYTPNKIATTLDDGSAARRFLTPEEEGALFPVTQGTKLSRTADYFAQRPWALGGVGPLAAAALGFHLGGPVGALGGIAGSVLTQQAAKSISRSTTRAAMEDARRVATGTPAATYPGYDAVNSASARDRLTALMAGMYSNQN
jgi:hypothetical protein